MTDPSDHNEEIMFKSGHFITITLLCNNNLFSWENKIKYRRIDEIEEGEKWVEIFIIRWNHFLSTAFHFHFKHIYLIGINGALYEIPFPIRTWPYSTPCPLGLPLNAFSHWKDTASQLFISYSTNWRIFFSLYNIRAASISPPTTYGWTDFPITITHCMALCCSQFICLTLDSYSITQTFSFIFPIRCNSFQNVWYLWKDINKNPR